MIFINLKKTVKQYFKSFNNHSSIQLSKLFANNIQLRDWEVNLQGKKAVLLHNNKIFRENKKINVKILKLFTKNKIVVAELFISINKRKNINVVDILTYNNKYLITSIKAFIG